MSVIDTSEHSAFAIAQRARARTAAESQPPVEVEAAAVWDDARWVRSPCRVIYSERYVNAGDPITMYALTVSQCVGADGMPTREQPIDRDDPATWQHLQPCSSLPDTVTGTFGDWRRGMHVEDPDADEPFSID